MVNRTSSAGIVPISDFNVGGIGPIRKSISGSTTVNLVARADFTVSTMAAYGTIIGIRTR